MTILGIETSCDETSAAIVENDGRNFNVLSNVVASQIKIHAKYGGIVPEVAARAHVEKIIPVIEEAVARAQKNLKTEKPKNRKTEKPKNRKTEKQKFFN